MPKMLSAKQPGDPVFEEGDEQIVMANPVWLFINRWISSMSSEQNSCGLQDRSEISKNIIVLYMLHGTRIPFPFIVSLIRCKVE